MNVLWIFLTVGMFFGVAAVLIAFTVDRLRDRFQLNLGGPVIPKTTVAGLGIGNMGGPYVDALTAGTHRNGRMSLNTVIMTPTKGLRLMSLGPGALLMWFTWGPMGDVLVQDQMMKIGLSLIVFYAVMYISSYEVRYNADGLTAPNWLFQNKHHPWEELISIQDDGHYVFRLRFESGKVSLQKYLVGMQTFLTFVVDVRELNKRP